MGGADSHIVVGIEGVGGVKAARHIWERTDVGKGHGQPQRQHDHLGELLTLDRVEWAEGTVREPTDDPAGGHGLNGGLVRTAPDVGETGAGRVVVVVEEVVVDEDVVVAAAVAKVQVKSVPMVNVSAEFFTAALTVTE